LHKRKEKLCYNLVQEERVMISCPYCGGEIPEDASFCPWCRSMLITGPEAEEPSRKKGLLFKLAHPWSAVAIISVVSVIMFILIKNPSRTSVEGKAMPTAGIDLSDQPHKIPAPVKSKEKKRKSDEKAEFYAEIIEYEKTVNSLFEKAERLISDPETLRDVEIGDEGVEPMSRRLQDVRPLLVKLRGIKPPRGLERCQTTLVNSMSMIQKAIRSEMMYLQTRQNRYLESAKQEQGSASKQQAYAMEIIDMVKAKNAPPPPPPEEETGPEEPEKVQAESPGTEPASTSTSKPTEPAEEEIQEDEGEEPPELEEPEEGDELEKDEEELEELEGEEGAEDEGGLELESGSTSEEWPQESPLENEEGDSGL